MKGALRRRLRELKPQRPMQEMPERERILAQLEGVDQLTLKGIRGLREFILAQAQIIEAHIQLGNLPPEASIINNVGIQKVQQLEQLAAQLREQLASLE